MTTNQSNHKRVSADADLLRLVQELAQKPEWKAYVQGPAIKLSKRSGETILLSQILDGRFWRIHIRTKRSRETYALLTPEEAEILAQRQLNLLDGTP